ncbi:sulfotransferase family 2 domain-containing protein [Roseofilum sp. Guam]|uniref:sulfotransferase family 2 domain-containing protein n=1 Tax=Roseofilum sp. Guam TaxID=2821502 RepID=UPI001B29E3DD|nr:sulfotransferase family 2 domain-containing protein [Roseofilum sp. Guam]MBP0028077.1 sulfotransferase family 2 domain-containing protein [Roseofilum sp. Guam]
MTNKTLEHTSESVLFFLHIPKTAGSTLHKIIERQYSSDEVFTIHGVNPQKHIDEFKKWSLLDKNRIKVVKGHMNFGLHESIGKPATYITILRHPIDRAISTYYYVLRSPSHHLYEYVTSKNISLQDFVCDGLFTDMDNGQTRRLSGISVGQFPGYKEVKFGECYPELLEQAKDNIDKNFAAIGIQEKFDESILMMKEKMNWKNCYYVKQNVSHGRVEKHEISEECRCAITQFNDLDIQLYEFVKEKIVQQIIEEESSFQKNLNKFQSYNRIYGDIVQFISVPRNYLRSFKKKIF